MMMGGAICFSSGCFLVVFSFLLLSHRKSPICCECMMVSGLLGLILLLFLWFSSSYFPSSSSSCSSFADSFAGVGCICERLKQTFAKRSLPFVSLLLIRDIFPQKVNKCKCWLPQTYVKQLIHNVFLSLPVLVVVFVCVSV